MATRMAGQDKNLNRMNDALNESSDRTAVFLVDTPIPCDHDGAGKKHRHGCQTFGIP